MPKTPADATRFTPTGPYVSSKQSASTIDIAAPPPPNETPAQKVVRLRAAARLARTADLTTWERIVLRGRRVADVSHRIVAGSLMMLSVVSIGVASLAIGEQVIYNRRKKKQYFAEQQANYARALDKAKQAESDGTLTEDQALFLNHDRAVKQAEAEQANKPGIWERVKDKAFGGLSKEERAGGAMGFAREELKADAERRLERERELGVASFEVEPVQAKIPGETPAVRSGAMTRGGPLDRLAERNAAEVRSTWRSWIDWFNKR